MDAKSKFLEVVTVIVGLKTISKERKMKTKIIKKKRKKEKHTRIE